MDTNVSSTGCCAGVGRKNKKVFIVIVFLLVAGVLSLVALRASGEFGSRIDRDSYGYGRSGMMSGSYGYGRAMMGRGDIGLSSSRQINNQDQFVTPDDAVKSGELAVVVDNLENAKKAVSDIAAKNTGNVYSTFISYAAGNLKNGSIVVQVPAANFDAAFGDLKKIGKQLVQESTRQVPIRNIYPMPLAASEKSVGKAVDEKAIAADDSSVASEVKPEIAIYPSPVQFQQPQDKGYIKIVFVDYGKGSAAGFATSAGQNQDNKLWVVFAIKLGMLIALLVILIIISKKILQNFRVIFAARKARPTVHVVRQMPKTRARIVRIAKKK